MRKRRRRSISENQTSLASQLMGLSLFVMLLAFFIVLNAISTFHEQKVRPALASIGNAFGLEIAGDGSMPSMAPSDDASVGEGDSLDHLEALFNAHLSGIEIKQDKTWGTMHIHLPLDQFVSALMAVNPGELKGQEAAISGKLLLPTLVSLLETGEQKLPYRMDIVVNTPDDPGNLYNNNPQKLKDLTRQVSSMSTHLERGGLPPRQMSIGLQKGRPNTVDLYFRPYIPFSPVQPQ